MKKLMTVCLLAVGLLATPQTMQAQGFLNKLSKGLDKVNKALDQVVSPTDEQPTDNKLANDGQKGTTQENGVTVVNPIPTECDIQLVGAYGTSKSENFGDVSLVFKVKLLVPKTTIYIGQGKAKSAAFDEDGNTYQFDGSSLVGAYECTEGMYVKVTHQYKIMDVRKKADKFQLIRVGLRTDWDHYGDLVLKNVPIDWDATAEQ